MSMVIGTNIGSITTQRHLESSRQSMESSMERLSSGQRVNSAMDDAAGLAIAGRMTAEIEGMGQAVRNANDAISMFQMAEGALDETTDILMRMRELAVQGATATASTSDKASMDVEFQALSLEITRIAEETKFNGNKMLDSTTAVNIQVGSAITDKIAFTFKVMDNANLSAAGPAPLVGTTAHTAGLGAVSATATSQVMTFGTGEIVAAGESATFEVGGRVYTQALIDSGGTAIENSNSTWNTLSQKVVAAEEGFTAMSISAAAGLILTATVDAGTNLGTAKITGTPVAPTNTSHTAGAAAVSATATAQVLTFASGEFVAAGEVATFEVGGTSYTQAFIDSGGTAIEDSNATWTALSQKVVGAEAGFTSLSIATAGLVLTAVVTAGTNAGSASIVNPSAGGAGGGVSTNDVLDTAKALASITAIDAAIAGVAKYRGELGGTANRLEHTVDNLMNRVETTSAARSQIMDTDFAAESANLAKAQVLQQAGTAMLAQANASGQSVLSLLK